MQKQKKARLGRARALEIGVITSATRRYLDAEVGRPQPAR